MSDLISLAAEKLSLQKHEIIDLFCKTFVLCQQPKSLDDLRDLFEEYELEIKICGDGRDMHWKYGLSRKLETS